MTYLPIQIQQHAYIFTVGRDVLFSCLFGLIFTTNVFSFYFYFLIGNGKSHTQQQMKGAALTDSPLHFQVEYLNIPSHIHQPQHCQKGWALRDQLARVHKNLQNKVSKKMENAETQKTIIWQYECLQIPHVFQKGLISNLLNSGDSYWNKERTRVWRLYANIEPGTKWRHGREKKDYKKEIVRRITLETSKKRGQREGERSLKDVGNVMAVTRPRARWGNEEIHVIVTKNRSRVITCSTFPATYPATTY